MHGDSVLWPTVDEPGPRVAAWVILWSTSSDPRYTVRAPADGAARDAHLVSEKAGSTMPDTPSSPLSLLAKKLRIRPGSSVRVLNAPDRFLMALEPLPTGAEIVHDAADVVLAFVRDSAQLAAVRDHALGATKPGGVLWFVYPKKSAGVTSDLGRDELAMLVSQASGWGPVAAVAIDETWSGLRFKPEASTPRGMRPQS